MNTALRSLGITLSAAVLSVYVTGYLYLKFECYSNEFVPSDPWKDSELSAKSRVTSWGESLTTPLPHKDPGLGLDRGFAGFLNAIYTPIRSLDEMVSGWSVKFNIRQEIIAAGESF